MVRFQVGDIGVESSPFWVSQLDGFIVAALDVLIDQEIRRLIDSALERARALLSGNKDKLHLLAKALLERETLTGDDVDELFGKERRSGSPKPQAADADASPPPADAGAPTDPPTGG